VFVAAISTSPSDCNGCEIRNQVSAEEGAASQVSCRYCVEERITTESSEKKPAAIGDETSW
jgi:hypothetical protein